MSEGLVMKYPLLEGMLSIQGNPLKSIYTNREVAALFGVSVRAIQDWIARRQLLARDLPGRGRFLPQDLETFLEKSSKKGQ